MNLYKSKVRDSGNHLYQSGLPLRTEGTPEANGDDYYRTDLGKNMALDVRHILGIDLGGTRTKIGFVDSKGTILQVKSFPTRLDLGKDRSLNQITHTLVHFIEAFKKGRKSIDLIGMGAPGIIDRHQGMIRHSPNFTDWLDVPIARIITKATGLPTFVDNDANVVPYGEKWVGAAQDLNHFACLTLGTGLGSGFFLNGRPWYGGQGVGPEFGHITVRPQGLLCGCGNRGCLETLVSAPYLVKKAQRGLQRNSSPFLMKTLQGDSKSISTQILARGARQGDPFCLGLFAEMGKSLGQALAGLVHILGIEGIILGGGVSRAATIFLPYLKKEFNKRLTMIPPEKISIRLSPLGETSGILGAAKMALDRFNVDPTVRDPQVQVKPGSR
jgi:glucokinase